jgi:hypothetical protein
MKLIGNPDLKSHEGTPLKNITISCNQRRSEGGRSVD